MHETVRHLDPGSADRDRGPSASLQQRGSLFRVCRLATAIGFSIFFFFFPCVSRRPYQPPLRHTCCDRLLPTRSFHWIKMRHFLLPIFITIFHSLDDLHPFRISVPPYFFFYCVSCILLLHQSKIDFTRTIAIIESFKSCKNWNQNIFFFFQELKKYFSKLWKFSLILPRRWCLRSKCSAKVALIWLILMIIVTVIAKLSYLRKIV